MSKYKHEHYGNFSEKGISERSALESNEKNWNTIQRRPKQTEQQLNDSLIYYYIIVDTLTVVKLSIATDHAMQIYNCLNCKLT